MGNISLTINSKRPSDLCASVNLSTIALDSGLSPYGHAATTLKKCWNIAYLTLGINLNDIYIQIEQFS